MQSIERIEVSKIYLGSAAKFALLFGLFIGFIIGVLVLISNLLLGVTFGSGIMENFGFAGTSSVFIFSGIVFALGFIGIFLISILLFILYNLVSQLGGKLHLGLAETEKEIPLEANKYKSVRLVSTDQKDYDISKLV